MSLRRSSAARRARSRRLPAQRTVCSGRSRGVGRHRRGTSVVGRQSTRRRSWARSDGKLRSSPGPRPAAGGWHGSPRRARTSARFLSCPTLPALSRHPVVHAWMSRSATTRRSWMTRPRWGRCFSTRVFLSMTSNLLSRTSYAKRSRSIWLSDGRNLASRTTLNRSSGSSWLCGSKDAMVAYASESSARRSARGTDAQMLPRADSLSVAAGFLALRISPACNSYSSRFTGTRPRCLMTS